MGRKYHEYTRKLLNVSFVPRYLMYPFVYVPCDFRRIKGTQGCRIISRGARHGRRATPQEKCVRVERTEHVERRHWLDSVREV